MYTKAVDSLLALETFPHKVRFFRGKGWCDARRHIEMCDKALAWGANYILMLGADQVFPEDLIESLVDVLLTEKVDAVAAQVPTRGYIEGNGLPPFGLQGWQLRDGSYEPVRGCVQRQPIDSIGSGCLMFKANLLDKLQRPWFCDVITDPETCRRVGTTDSVFVHRLKTEAGAKVLVDTTIPIHHLHTFEIDHTFSDRFSDWAMPGVGDTDVCKFKGA